MHFGQNGASHFVSLDAVLCLCPAVDRSAHEWLELLVPDHLFQLHVSLGAQFASQSTLDRCPAELDGVELGATLGMPLGTADTVGAAEMVGADDGSELNVGAELSDGTADGALLGKSDGAADGATLGALEGSCDGLIEGAVLVGSSPGA